MEYPHVAASDEGVLAVVAPSSLAGRRLKKATSRRRFCVRTAFAHRKQKAICHKCSNREFSMLTYR